MKLKKRLLLILLPYSLSSGVVYADALTIAVASNFVVPMKALTKQFEAESGQSVRVASGSSGKLYMQIVQGAPFALFFSADQEKPEKLVQKGLAVADSQFTYATGSLVLWSAQYDTINKPEAILKAGDFQRLAIANPRLAPYGVAAKEVLQTLNLYEALEPKLIQGENINQTFQFVATKNAELGFVAASQVMKSGSQKEATGWWVPETYYSPIRQDAVLLTRAKDNAAAKAMLSFLKGAKAKTIIRQHGYH